MRRKRSVMAAVAGMMAAMAMMLGITMPSVHAGDVHRPETVTVNVTILQEGDRLAYPTWGGVATQGMEIRYLYENGDVINTFNTSDKSDYTIQTYSELTSEPLPEGMTSASWLVVEVPTQDPAVMRWDLKLYTGNSVSSGDAGRQPIKSPGAYELQSGVTYTLENGLRRVQGDATIYASPVEFTVSAGGKYNFFY